MGLEQSSEATQSPLTETVDNDVMDREPDRTSMVSSQPDTSEKSQVPVTLADKFKDISNNKSFDGNITKEDQRDRYKYTAEVDGTYCFDTDLSAGGSVIVRISGENDESINYSYDRLIIDLEAGKTYILSIEYRNSTCDYTVNIGVPKPVSDISDITSVSGSITYEDQKDKYLYAASVTGTYRFDTDLSAGGSVIVRISGENGQSIDYSYDALSIDLEAGKKYILSIEHRNNVCDYTVNIGVPMSITDISDDPTSVSGKINYRDQKDKYYYTAPVTGTYRFETNLSAGGSVIVRISGENGKSIDYRYDALTIDLEADKTYILSIEYRNGTCVYNLATGIPISISDITGNSAVSGNITYQDQKDKYIYTAPITGTYHFNTNLIPGCSVIVRISGENSNSISYGYDSLKIDLEAGKTYILSIEYRKDVCSYDLSIVIPEG